MRAIRTRAFLAVAATTMALTAAPPAAADPAGSFVEPVTVLHEIREHTGRFFYGWAVSELGDVDGDGLMDRDGGAVRRHARRRGGSSRTGERLHSAVGAKGDLLSYAEADAGDTDGDGISDYVVGAPGNGAGHALVFSGATGEVLLRLDGEAAGDVFGAAVAGAGDVNGDGRADVLVGAPAAEGAGVNSGRVYVLSGADGRPAGPSTDGVRRHRGRRAGLDVGALGGRRRDLVHALGDPVPPAPRPAHPETARGVRPGRSCARPPSRAPAADAKGRSGSRSGPVARAVSLCYYFSFTCAVSRATSTPASTRRTRSVCEPLS